MRKLLLSISYDGTDFCGWQRQSTDRTVQQTIENTLTTVIKEEIKLLGCSRTDAGVHALDQKATFKTECKIPTDKFALVLNAALPKDILITNCQEVPMNFHPRHEALKKQYGYTIYNSKLIDIRDRRYVWHIPQKLNVSEMKKACKYLIGEHDFSTFCAAGSQVQNKIRTIYRADFTENNNKITFTIEGNGFLYKMVRIIVGTLVDIGLSKTKADEMSLILASKSRERATTTAPALGLCLQKIYYGLDNSGTVVGR